MSTAAKTRLPLSTADLMQDNASLNHINLPVRDLSVAKTFYIDVLGFTLIHEFVDQSDNLCKSILQFQDFYFFIEQVQHTHSDHAFHFGFQMSFETLQEMYDLLPQRGITLYGNLEENPPFTGTHRFYLQDPDGTVIELYDAI